MMTLHDLELLIADLGFKDEDLPTIMEDLTRHAVYVIFHSRRIEETKK